VSLDLDPGVYQEYEFPFKNLTYQVKRQSLHRIRSRVGHRIPRGRVKILVHKTTRRAYTSLNIERTRPAMTPDDEAVIAELDREFAPWNDELARKLHIDLAAWE
jgi:hypothetical protein